MIKSPAVAILAVTIAVGTHAHAATHSCMRPVPASQQTIDDLINREAVIEGFDAFQSVKRIEHTIHGVQGSEHNHRHDRHRVHWVQFDGLPGEEHSAHNQFQAPLGTVDLAVRVASVGRLAPDCVSTGQPMIDRFERGSPQVRMPPLLSH